MKTYGVAVVGCGHWGRNLIRAFRGNERTRLVALVDPDPAAWSRIATLASWTGSPAPAQTADLDRALAPDVDLVAVATPPASHYAVALRALAAGKHVLVEKPLALRLDEAAELVRLAAARQLSLSVDFTYLHSPGFRWLRAAIGSTNLGRLRHVDCRRENLGRWQADCDVAWDLLPHDLAILDGILGPAEPEVLSAVGEGPAGKAEVAHVVLDYGGVVASLTASWQSPEKVRRVVVRGEDAMAVWDDLSAARVVLHRKRLSRDGGPDHDDGALPFGVQPGAPEPLADEVAHLVDGLDYRTPGLHVDLGLRVVRTLEEISAKMRRLP